MKQIDALPTDKNNIQELVKLRIQERKNLDNTFKGQILEINNLGTTINYERKNITTIKKEFDMDMIDTFYHLYKDGRIKKELRPVHWCAKCATYKRRKDLKFVKKDLDNYYVLYRVEDDKGLFSEYKNLKNTYFVVSNIRPWTMVTSENIAIAKELKYSLVETTKNNVKYHYIIASKYVDEVMQKEFIIKYDIKETYKAIELKNILCMNPLDYRKRVSIILTNEEYVCYDDLSSTGIRTVSSGHTYLDYLILKDTKKEAIKVVLNEHGVTNGLAIVYNGMNYLEINAKIIDYLKESDFIYTIQKAKVSVPTCDKCESETIYRCVNEWYVLKPDNSEITEDMVNSLETKMIASKKFKDEEFKRSINSINNTKEALISDKNIIGTPIPVFYCADCGAEIVREKTIEIIKKAFDARGSDTWYKQTPEELLQGQISCKCGCGFFFKENATLNNFFKYICINENTEKNNEEYEICIESKKSFLENLKAIAFMKEPNKYLDELNQILIHSNVRQKATKEILNENTSLEKAETKNTKVDEKNKKKNKKFSKDFSKGNKKKIGTANIKVENEVMNTVNDYGTDILRLWAAMSSSGDKITLNRQSLININRKYKNIRRTFKYIIANLYDFNPTKNYVALNERNDIDKYIYIKLSKLINEVKECYNKLDFYNVYLKLMNFCMETLCNNYFESIKYNLYIQLANNKKRRSVQSNLYDIILVISNLWAPLIPYTLEEIWPYIWHKSTEEERNLYANKIVLNDIKVESEENTKLEQKWDKIFAVKQKLDKKIKKAQGKKFIKNSLEAKVVVNTNEFTDKFIKENYRALLECINVSSIESNVTDKHDVDIQKEPGQKCARCGHYTEEIGKELKYRYLCPECAKILEEE